MAITDKMFDSIAQRAHICGGALAVTLPSALGVSHNIKLIIIGAFVGWCAFKEFYWDYKYETPEVRGSSLSDFLHYMLGIGLALLILWIGERP